MLDRRTLLKEAAGLGGALWVARAMVASEARATSTGWTLPPAERRTLAHLQDRLLPSRQGVPGARDLHATAYLVETAASSTVKDGERADLRRGLKDLDRAARRREGKAFAALSTEKQDDVLRAFQADGGEPFMALVMVYTLEALLGDPVYGVNPGGIGWTWLRHDPRFPRPAAPWRAP